MYRGDYLQDLIKLQEPFASCGMSDRSSVTGSGENKAPVVCLRVYGNREMSESSDGGCVRRRSWANLVMLQGFQKFGCSLFFYEPTIIQRFQTWRIYSSALMEEEFRLLLQKYFHLSKVLIYYSRRNSPALINPAFRSMLTWFHMELISFSIIQYSAVLV